MLLYERARKEGQLLFRWRSYFPIVLIPVAALAMLDAHITEDSVGEAIAEGWEALSALVAISGLALRWVTVGYAADGTSGRNTRGQRADRLNTAGLYSVVRNPLYVGNALALMGILMSSMVWYLVLVGALAYWLYIERIIAVEEAYLADKFGEEYRAWAARTPAFLPRPALWTRPSGRFRLRKVLRQEFHGVIAIAVGFVAVDAFMDIVLEQLSIRNWVRDDLFDLVAVALLVILSLTLGLLKKHTRVLAPEKR